jgi:tripeptide aminopeptidase
MESLNDIVAALPRYREAADGMREVMLANLALVGEIPAPTFLEEARVRWLVERFAESGLQDCRIDEKGNGTAVLPGTERKGALLLVAHCDTAVDRAENQDVEIKADKVIGPFAGDNSAALAALATLPQLLERLEIRLGSDLHLLATPRALGRGNLESLRHFLAEPGARFAAGLCLESVQLGRLNYACVGMARGEIGCSVPDDYDWARFGATGSIIPMGEVIGRISLIPIPNRPLASIVMGSIQGGFSYSHLARETRLRLEVRSESVDILQQLLRQIEDIVHDVAAHSGTRIGLDILTQRGPGGIEIAHPLVRVARAVMAGLGLQPNLYATVSLMAALHDAKIPALTVGLTTGERRGELEEIEEALDIAPMSAGLAQVAGILQAADGGMNG